MQAGNAAGGSFAGVKSQKRPGPSQVDDGIGRSGDCYEGDVRTLEVQFTVAFAGINAWMDKDDVVAGWIL